MSFGLLGIGTSGLSTAQRALDTTGHNIANVNTKGYSRQTVEQETRNPLRSPVGYVGQGVNISAIKRMYDDFVQTQLRATTTTSEYFGTQYGFTKRIDNLLADAAAGLSPGLQKFFSSFQELANDPTSTAQRTVVLAESESLVDRFHFLDQRLKDQQTIVNGQIETAVDEINGIAQSIAQLNQQISSAWSRGMPPNDLLDKREQLLLDLSKFVDVSTVEAGQGGLNVFIGSGQTLVMGHESHTLQARAPSPGMPLEIGFAGTGDISRKLSNTGHLGGLLTVRSTLEQTQNDLGRTAVSIALAFNNQHRAGVDLNGDPGGDLFQVPRPGVIPSRPGSELPEVRFDPAELSKLKTSDYRLSYDGTDWTLRTHPQGTAVPLPDADANGDIRVNGLIINLPAGAEAGDRFMLQPTRNAARDIRFLMDDPNTLAAAPAVIANPAATNTGHAQVQSVSVVDPTAFGNWDGSEITVTFDSADPAAAGFEKLADDVWRVLQDGMQITIHGTPQEGDSFVLNPNANPTIGDNRNALAMTGIQGARILDNGMTDIEGSYNMLIADIGTQTRKLEVASEAQQRLLADAINQRETISGVNLDEEAANLIRYQQAYQASAQVISASNALFDTLIGIVRR
ncbi:flagellar hook-associated protein 1 FlgK [Ectothiorhodospira magna]|uniref:Flagellar hook-associated protein 1 n=1 Tax=Ectothiorhodospira magna TaxID=867345 RepID=A0A1H9DES2_9GAMM|nr:flagellar hook-associated protein FlgK [Ectothiorhodospira magna]SEQ12012.1 flagellar hook-associated protein 1 FlgK [Ectothiorhodospira magna]